MGVSFPLLPPMLKISQNPSDKFPFSLYLLKVIRLGFCHLPPKKLVCSQASVQGQPSLIHLHFLLWYSSPSPWTKNTIYVLSSPKLCSSLIYPTAHFISSFELAKDISNISCPPEFSHSAFSPKLSFFFVFPSLPMTPVPTPPPPKHLALSLVSTFYFHQFPQSFNKSHQLYYKLSLNLPMVSLSLTLSVSLSHISHCPASVIS